MTQHGGLSTDELWRRVGLEELREAVKRVSGTMQQFERTLKALKQAMAIVEQGQQSLSEAPPQPCRCAGEPCCCHS